MRADVRLSAEDRAELAAAGIAVAEAERQLELLASPPPRTRLLKPATIGDGVIRLEPGRETELIARACAARDAGRFTKFVPASGAATRMFRALYASEDGDLADPGDIAEKRRTLMALPTTAIGHEISRLAGGVSPDAWLRTPAGRAFAAQPKALLPFHLDSGEVRTAFADQIAEGLEYLVDRRSRARFHFTLPDASRVLFEPARRAWRRRAGAGVEITFSEQRRSTHALALDDSGRPARLSDGKLLLRPSGHGALLDNLNALGATGADLVFLKNIDNILPASRHAEIARTKLLLAGLLLELEEQRPRRTRPLRVCGVVANAGEPGGGPFWIAGADRAPSLQIVESAEVDFAAAAQREIWNRSTHFNPVDLVVGLRDATGRPFDLARFVDPARVFVADKSEGGRRLRVYERPGLWNGAMAGLETLFVELPAWTFAPVKTLLDLARPEHRVASPA